MKKTPIIIAVVIIAIAIAVAVYFFVIKKGNDNFPLQEGSKGTRVKELQIALNKVIENPEKYGAWSFSGGKLAVDGVFGASTKAALEWLGQDVVLSESAFKKILDTVKS